MGEVFAGRYELVDPIGRGGVGAVWRAWDHRRRRYVAAKVLQQSDAHALLRFVREQALRIDHPHVLAPASWAADDDKVLFTMDLVAGGSLVHLVNDYGPLPAPFVCVLLDQLLAGLAAVHAEGVIHRDIKPANVLLEATGMARPRLRLSDFGIAMRLGEPRLTETNYVVGTPGYFAPEQMLGAEPDFPADLFAVGLVALYLLEGAKPDAKALIEYFAAHGTPSAPRGIPEPLWQVVATLVQPDPHARFRTATGARKALASAAELLPEPGPDDELIEVFDQLGPVPEGFGPKGPLRTAPGLASGGAFSRRRQETTAARLPTDGTPPWSGPDSASVPDPGAGHGQASGAGPASEAGSGPASGPGAGPGSEEDSGPRAGSPSAARSFTADGPRSSGEPLSASPSRASGPRPEDTASENTASESTAYGDSGYGDGPYRGSVSRSGRTGSRTRYASPEPRADHIRPAVRAGDAEDESAHNAVQADSTPRGAQPNALLGDEHPGSALRNGQRLSASGTVEPGPAAHTAGQEPASGIARPESQPHTVAPESEPRTVGPESASRAAGPESVCPSPDGASRSAAGAVPALPASMSDTGSFHLPPPQPAVADGEARRQPERDAQQFPQQPPHPQDQALSQAQAQQAWHKARPLAPPAPVVPPVPAPLHPPAFEPTPTPTPTAAPTPTPTHVPSPQRPAAPAATMHQPAYASTASYTARSPQVPPQARRVPVHRARRARPRPGPPPKVAVPMFLIALACFAVGFWALTQI
ncbi:serine/threonine protein kinase [Streptomyces sp. 142MFCol3.1]|uniref:serine/threonine protein kinase n=1 Tax=Streptomyces sp. 142MFCol3.1 TaxID=1172179 RepID=UPI0004133843|nr:serine/threonine protein kinase [Streptomyces sp. 142MFCol3.1]